MSSVSQNEMREQLDAEEASRKRRPEFKSYGDIVWEQFRKNRMGFWSLIGVGVLFFIALVSPFVALNVPFYLSVPQGTTLPPGAVSGGVDIYGVSFPWFLALFDSNFFESGVDIFFNIGLFFVPAWLLGWVGVKRFALSSNKKKRSQQSLRYWLLGAALWMVLFGLVFWQGYSAPFIDYKLITGLEGVDAIYPFWDLSYRETNVDLVKADISWAHWLGTDREGRDIWTRMLYGTRISLTIGVVAVAIYTFIGVILGSVGGYFGGKIDAAVLRIIEVMLCFPTFFLILTIRGFIDNPSIFHIMLIIGLTGWTRIARLVRGEFLRVKNQDFVQAAIALGFRQNRIIFRHILPNALGPVLVAATFGVAGAILIEASLSFLGLGSPTAPSWGQILTEGKDTSTMTMILAPGFAIFLTVSLLNLFGEGVRDALDPKLRR